MKTRIYAFVFLLLVSSCTLPPLECFLFFNDYEKTYNFNWSKAELKNRIVEAYSYDKSLLRKNLGMTLVENEDVNSKYRKSVDVWLDKRNWDNFKAEIRNNTSDTLNITIGKHHSRTQLSLLAIVEGNEQKSSLTIKGFEYMQGKACEKEKEYYEIKLSNKIEKELIDKLN